MGTNAANIQSNTDNIATNAQAITDTNTKIDNLGDGLTDNIDDNNLLLTAAINALEDDMEEADDELQANIDAVNADLQTTKTDLSDEVARGAVRDATLQDHEARIQLLRTDTDANSDAIANVNTDLIIKINNVTEVINENANSGSADLDALRAD